MSAATLKPIRMECCLPTTTDCPSPTNWVCFEPTTWPDTCCSLHRIPVSLHWTNAHSVIFSELIRKFCKLSCIVSNILPQFLIPKADASTVFFCSRTSTDVFYPSEKNSSQSSSAPYVVYRSHHNKQRTSPFVARSLNRHVGLKVATYVWRCMPKLMLVCCVVSVLAPMPRPSLRQE